MSATLSVTITLNAKTSLDPQAVCARKDLKATVSRVQVSKYLWHRIGVFSSNVISIGSVLARKEHRAANMGKI